MRVLKVLSPTFILAGIFVFALSASAAATPQHGGGGHFGGPHGGFHGGPGHFEHSRVIVRGGFGFYDPFWGPYWGWGYPYWGYPYGYAEPTTGSVKTDVTPKQAEVYVDGYYAGVADNFDGTFKHLNTSPGGHTLTVYLDGYRTVTRNVYVQPDHTAKLNLTMEKLRPGEVSEPPPVPARPDAPPVGLTPKGNSGPMQH
jgi:PEGA domain